MTAARTILLAVLFFCLTYTAASMLAGDEVHALNPSRIDVEIAFLPWTMAIYGSQVLLIVLALWLAPSAAERKNLLAAMAVAIAVSVTVFIVWPAAIKRPDPHGFVFEALYAIDAPSNAFPSLSIALVVIAAALWPHSRTRPLAWLWAFAIAVSALTTKQQVVASALAGAFVAFVALVWSGAVERALRRATVH